MEDYDEQKGEKGAAVVTHSALCRQVLKLHTHHIYITHFGTT